MNIEDFEGLTIDVGVGASFVLKAIGRGEFDFDDADEIADAKSEASNKAKALMVRFMKQSPIALDDLKKFVQGVADTGRLSRIADAIANAAKQGSLQSVTFGSMVKNNKTIQIEAKMPIAFV